MFNNMKLYIKIYKKKKINKHKYFNAFLLVSIFPDEITLFPVETL